MGYGRGKRKKNAKRSEYWRKSGEEHEAGGPGGEEGNDREGKRRGEKKLKSKGEGKMKEK